MKHYSAFLFSAAGFSLLGACGDPSTAPSMTGRVTDTVSTATASRSYLIALDANLAWLGVSPTGDTTRFPPSVLVTDYRHRGKANVAVNFEIVSGGGTLPVSQAMSGANGVATPGPWRLGKTPGVNIIRATSPANNDTVYIKLEAVNVDSTPMDGRYVLDRIDSVPLPTMMKDGFNYGAELLSASMEIHGSRFVFTWSFRWDSDAAVTQHVEGSVGGQGPYIEFQMDGVYGPDLLQCPALLLADGRLRIGKYVEDWPLFGRLQDFRRAR